jgi:hypothetical protein
MPPQAEGLPHNNQGGEVKRRVPALIPFLAVVSAIFIGILIYAYVEAKKANPQMLDEQGRIVRTS